MSDLANNKCPKCNNGYYYEAFMDKEGFGKCITWDCPNYDNKHHMEVWEEINGPPKKEEQEDTDPGIGGLWEASIRQGFDRNLFTGDTFRIAFPDGDTVEIKPRVGGGISVSDGYKYWNINLPAQAAPMLQGQTTGSAQGPKEDHSESEPEGGHPSESQSFRVIGEWRNPWPTDGPVVEEQSNTPQSTGQLDLPWEETPLSLECSGCRSHLSTSGSPLGFSGFQRMTTFYATTKMHLAADGPNERSHKQMNPCCRRAMLQHCLDRLVLPDQSPRTPDSEDQPASRTDTPTELRERARQILDWAAGPDGPGARASLGIVLSRLGAKDLPPSYEQRELTVDDLYPLGPPFGNRGTEGKPSPEEILALRV